MYCPSSFFSHMFYFPDKMLFEEEFSTGANVWVFYSISQDMELVCRLGLSMVVGGGDWDSWSRPSEAHTCVCLDTHARSCMQVWLLIRSRSPWSWINTLAFVFPLALRLTSELLLPYHMQIRHQWHSLKEERTFLCFLFLIIVSSINV